MSHCSCQMGSPSGDQLSIVEMINHYYPSSGAIHITKLRICREWKLIAPAAAEMFMENMVDTEEDSPSPHQDNIHITLEMFLGASSLIILDTSRSLWRSRTVRMT